MADAVSASFKTFESDFLDGKKIGGTAEVGIHVFNTASGCISAKYMQSFVWWW